MIDSNHRYLSIVLLLTGVAFIGLYFAGVMFPDAWWWEPRQPEYEQMLMGVYATLGVFAILAARAPTKHLSLIWFIAVSNIVHGGIMLFQAVGDPMDQANLMGDVPALIIVGIAIAILTPMRLESD